MNDPTRRSFMQTAGAAVAGTAGVAPGAAGFGAWAVGDCGVPLLCQRKKYARAAAITTPPSKTTHKPGPLRPLAIRFRPLIFAKCDGYHVTWRQFNDIRQVFALRGPCRRLRGGFEGHNAPAPSPPRAQRAVERK